MLTKVKLNDPVELQVFIELVTRTSILEHLNEGEKKISLSKNFKINY